MHQIGVVGLSYRHAGVDEVARFAVPRTEVPARLPELRTLLKAAEILYVGTCNRVEVVYATDDGSAAGDSRQDVFRILTGRGPHLRTAPRPADGRGSGNGAARAPPGRRCALPVPRRSGGRPRAAAPRWPSRAGCVAGRVAHDA